MFQLADSNEEEHPGFGRNNTSSPESHITKQRDWQKRSGWQLRIDLGKEFKIVLHSIFALIQVCRANCNVVFLPKVLCEVIRYFFSSILPLHSELTWVDPIPDPVDVHIDCFTVSLAITVAVELLITMKIGA
jgi:hypothetical protein